jgi:hypothetical protein
VFTPRAFCLSAVISVPMCNLKLNKYGNMIGERSVKKNIFIEMDKAISREVKSAK